MNVLRSAVSLLFTLTCVLTAMPLPAEPTLSSSIIGDWGGEHIRLVVKETSASVEFDCAFGEIDGPIHPDKYGHFEVSGTYMFERGGPARRGQPPPKRHPAAYRGWTNGKEMHLTVILLDGGKDVGTFSLGLGRRASLEKCL